MRDVVMDDAQPELSRDDRWYEAVARRDRAFDGTFLYGVRTTGVYCRPSCAARLARRDNVSFHLSRAAAERAGLRPCKRCRPDGPDQAAREAGLVRRACRAIDAAVGGGESVPGLAALADAAGLSPWHFHRLFKRVLGVTPRAYGVARRADRLREGLPGADSVTHALYDAGFGAPSRFYEDAASHLGMTPGAYRRGGADAAIRYAVVPCWLGTLLVAATARGVCAIALGDDAASLVQALEARFPKATLAADDRAFAGLLARVVALVEAPGEAAGERGDGLPLDIRGTAFQRRVWEALRAIPAGRTASYAEIARAIGAPEAARAVARACAGNGLAVAIPCHRVVRGDGGLAGYRWGVARKQALLAREAGR